VRTHTHRSISLESTLTSCRKCDGLLARTTQRDWCPRQ
jgi:hypothetical protein